MEILYKKYLTHFKSQLTNKLWTQQKICKLSDILKKSKTFQVICLKKLTVTRLTKNLSLQKALLEKFNQAVKFW